MLLRRRGGVLGHVGDVSYYLEPLAESGWAGEQAGLLGVSEMRICVFF